MTWQTYTDPGGNVFIISAGDVRTADTIAQVCLPYHYRAPLIAQAPELLEVAKRALAMDLERLDKVNGAALHAMARAAIIKAEGRQP
jgi:hypothetical protein